MTKHKLFDELNGFKLEDASERKKFVELLSSVDNINDITDGYFPLFFYKVGTTSTPLEIIEALIDKGVNIESFYRFGFNTPLSYAAMSGNNSLIKLFLSKGADINGRAEADPTLTPLHWAIKNLKLPSFRILIEHGADVNEMVAEGKPISSLMLALQSTNSLKTDGEKKSVGISIIKTLVSKGAKLENEMIPIANKISPTLGKELMSLSLNYHEKLAHKAAKEIYGTMLDLTHTALPEDLIFEITGYLESAERLHPKSLHAMSKSANNFYNNRTKNVTHTEKLGSSFDNYIPTTIYNYFPSFIKQIVKEGPKTNLQAIMEEPAQYFQDVQYTRSGRS